MRPAHGQYCSGRGVYGDRCDGHVEAGLGVGDGSSVQEVTPVVRSLEVGRCRGAGVGVDRVRDVRNKRLLAAVCLACGGKYC